VVCAWSADQQAAECRAAADLLLLIGERGGGPMLANIAMLRALHRDRLAPETPRRKAAKCPPDRRTLLAGCCQKT